MIRTHIASSKPATVSSGILFQNQPFAVMSLSFCCSSGEGGSGTNVCNCGEEGGVSED